MSDWIWKDFTALTQKELYEIAKVRQKVFVVEQNCAFLDLDDLDYNAWHLFKTGSFGEVIAYLRLVESGGRFTSPSIGRLLTSREARRTGQGRQIMAEGIKRAKDMFPGKVIRISAQQYLEDFYASFGFKKTGAPYLDDDIPHIDMYLPAG